MTSTPLVLRLSGTFCLGITKQQPLYWRRIFPIPRLMQRGSLSLHSPATVSYLFSFHMHCAHRLSPVLASAVKAAASNYFTFIIEPSDTTVNISSVP